ncbi:MAG TPA: hypothetical protein VL860_10905, partial [Planctomycetota bacterium]|nr:hypothetical protein [Planctomycetota bacterium]
MAQVRICLSCGTIWKDGTLAYIDGFCLHCPGELGPPTDAAKAGDAAWAAKVAATAAAAAKIETTGKPAQVDLGAITATRQSPKTPPVESPR